MCGRYVQTKRARDRIKILVLRQQEARREETCNLAPSTLSLVVRATPEGLSADWLTWGLEVGRTESLRPINARVETAATKFTFREAWKSRRCVVPADGWFEWKAERGRKQPYYFHRRDNQPVFFAGLLSGDTFCLLTSEADGDLIQVHERRPLTLRYEEAAPWIESPPSSPEKVVSYVVPASDIAFHPVSPRVSSPRNDGADLILPVESATESAQRDLF